MNWRLALGALILLGLGLVFFILPPPRVAYTTDPGKVAEILHSLVPGAAVPPGFVGKLGMPESLVILGGQRREIVAVLAGQIDELAARVGGRVLRSERQGPVTFQLIEPPGGDPDVPRYLWQEGERAVLVQGLARPEAEAAYRSVISKR